MKKSKNKIIIKTKNGGYTKLYADGKWQKKVYDINFQAWLNNGRISVVCCYDKYKTNKNGIPMYDKKTLKLLTEHCSVMI